jgi:hypothetical protein
MKIESIYAQVFQIKCSRIEGENKPRGKKKPWLTKILMGGGLSFLIILIIWFPMVFFAYSTALGYPSKPSQFGMVMYFNGNEPFFATAVERDSLRSFTSEEYKSFKKIYDHSPQARSFIEEFDEQDLVVAKLVIDSTSFWRASPPSINRIIANLRNSSKVSTIVLTLEIIQSFSDTPFDLHTQVERELSNQTCQAIADMLEGKLVNESATIEMILPKMLQLQNNGKISVLSNDLIKNSK